jgi:hypothetical protein
MGIKVKQKLKKASNRSFLAKDFEAYRISLINHAKVFFADKIQDFSEPSVGGMLVDLMATIGDSLSFYLDHQYRELDAALAVEPENIITHVRNAGVELYGAASALAELEFSIKVPAELVGANYIPKKSALPVILKNTVCSSIEGIATFIIFDDVNFAEEDADGNLVAPYSVSETSSGGVPTEFEMRRTTVASSGNEKTESKSISDLHVPFRQITLEENNITMIRSILDSEFNEYHEVKSLSQDTVFVPVQNFDKDSVRVKSNLEILAAPHRFTREYNPITKLTTVRFGSGDADVLDDDILPDPSDLALELYGKNTIPRFSIDPNSLLKTQTLGISPKSTTLSITYRYGGGANHNVGAQSIIMVDDLKLSFRKSPSVSDAVSVRASVEVTNMESAKGGADAPDLEALRGLIIPARMSQGRMVTSQDVLARIYTLPSIYGRVFRASISENPINPQATTVYLISQDSNGDLSLAPDALKINLSNYLNEFRLISDAYDMLDAQVVNFGVKYEVVTARNANKQQVITNINNSLAKLLQLKNFQIDQPIMADDISATIIATNFVIAISNLRVFPRSGTIEERTYASSAFPFENSTKSGMIFGPRGSIFELKHPEHDIIGSAV